MGRQIRGERNRLAKLNQAKVREIRALYQRSVRGRGYRTLAQRFDISLTTIKNIISGEDWAHVA